MVARERRQRHRHIGLGLGLDLVDEAEVRVGGAPDQAMRLFAAELQHDIGRKLVGRVLLAPEDRHIVDVEHRMSEFVQRREHQLPDERLFLRDPLHRRFLRQVLPDLLQIFVAEADGRKIVLAEEIGVRNAIALDRLDIEIFRQPEWAEQLPDLLERTHAA